jgi:hypothetical protein
MITAVTAACLAVFVLIVWASVSGRMHDACMPHCKCGRLARFHTKHGWQCECCWGEEAE